MNAPGQNPAILCMSAHWSELAACLQPQEGRETNLIGLLEAGAEKKGSKCSRGPLPSANLSNQREHAAKLIPNTTGHQSPHPRLPCVLAGMNHRAFPFLPTACPMSQPFILQPLRSRRIHILSVLNSTSALPLETKHQPKQVRRLRNWVRDTSRTRKWLPCMAPLEKEHQLDVPLTSENQELADPAGGMNTWLCLQMGNKDLGSQGRTSPSVADPWPRHGPLVCFLAGHSPVLVWFGFFPGPCGQK